MELRKKDSKIPNQHIIRAQLGRRKWGSVISLTAVQFLKELVGNI